MNTEADEFQHVHQVGAPATKVHVADLLFAAVVVAIAGAWIALVALRFFS